MIVQNPWESAMHRLVIYALGGALLGVAQVEEKTGLPAEAIVRIATDTKPPGKRNGPGNVMMVAISPDSRYVATGENFIVRIFERLTGRPVRSFPVEPHQITDLAFTPDGKGLLVAVAYHPARLWDVESGKEKQSFKGSLGSVRGVMRFALSHDGTHLALAVNEPAVQLARISDGTVLRKLGEKQLIDRLAFAPDGKTLAGGGFDQKLHLWDTTKGKELWVTPNGTSIVAVAFSPDGKRIATGDYSGLKLWDPKTGKTNRIVRLGFSAVRTVAFSPDSRLVAAAGDGADAVLLDAETGAELRHLSGGRIWSLAFSPDGQTLVTAGHDTTAIVWDVTGRRFVAPPKGPVTAEYLTRLWTDLGKPEGLAGHEAQWRLTVLDEKSVPFLDRHLRTIELPNAAVLAGHIADLGNEEFAVREAAMTALEKIGKSAIPDLRRALANNPSPETKGRLQTLLRAHTEPTLDPRVRASRAVAALEAMTAPSARSLLQHLADKGADEEIRQGAAAAFRRIQMRAPTKKQ